MRTSDEVTMSESRSKRPRITPRNSFNANEQPLLVETPHSNLRQLAGIVNQPTPNTGQRSAGIGSRTPGTLTRDDRLRHRRPAPARRGPPTTPHAIRALQTRRNAALTPGRDRRRSGRMQRETPRDTLRNLSRLLAGTSQAIKPSPEPEEKRPPRHPALNLDDDDLDSPAPRLSFALQDSDDDDSFHEAPPRLSLALEDMDNLTSLSLEAGRRAFSEDPRPGFRRTSIGGTRLSERFADLNALGFGTVSEADEAEFGQLDETQGLIIDGDDLVPDDTTNDLGDALSARAHMRSRMSDIDVDRAEASDEDTFRFIIPARGRDRSEIQLPAPEVDDAQADAVRDDAQQESEEEQIYQPGFEEELTAGSDIEMDAPLRTDPDIQAKQKAGSKRPRSRREMRVSKHGIEYPVLPQSMVKKLAASLARGRGGNTRIPNDTLAAIVQASDWFFEQAAEDVASYADHAGRKTIDESDVISLMKRQRQINTNNTAFSLAQKFLPRELLQNVRMEQSSSKKRRKKQLESIVEGEEES